MAACAPSQAPTSSSTWPRRPNSELPSATRLNYSFPVTRSFLLIRKTFTPYERIASRLPQEGSVLDLGCGHGLLCVAAARGSSHRRIVGVDHDPKRVAWARKSGRRFPNLSFVEGDLARPPEGSYSAITLIDVLHYFESRTQRAIIDTAFSLLPPGGTLLVREIDARDGVLSRCNQAYERLAVKSGLTRANRAAMHFRSRSGWKALLQEAGFRVEIEKSGPGFLSDTLFVCQRNAGKGA